MKSKRLKLRSWVKVVLVILFFMIMYFSTIDVIERYSDISKKCDEEKGYICSYYEIRNYRGE